MLANPLHDSQRQLLNCNSSVVELVVALTGRGYVGEVNHDS